MNLILCFSSTAPSPPIFALLLLWLWSENSYDLLALLNIWKILAWYVFIYAENWNEKHVITLLPGPSNMFPGREILQLLSATPIKNLDTWG
jgi:hypothetical protein